MEEVHSKLQHRFLYILGSPFEEFCCTLKTALFVTTIWEVFIGIQASLDLIGLGLGYTSEAIPPYFLYALCFYYIFLLLKASSAILAYKAVSSLQIHYILYYYITSLISIPINLLFNLSLLWLSEAPHLLFFLAILSDFSRLFLCKIAWSAYIRLSNNESVLVQYGKQRMLLVHQENQFNHLGSVMELAKVK